MTHIRFRHQQAGGHVHVRVFVGPDVDHLAKSGDLAFREDERDKEWTAFRDAVAGGPTVRTVDFVDEDEEGLRYALRDTHVAHEEGEARTRT